MKIVNGSRVLEEFSIWSLAQGSTDDVSREIIFVPEDATDGDGESDARREHAAYGGSLMRRHAYDTEAGLVVDEAELVLA